MENDYKLQHTDIEFLKQRTEILREEDKQEKLNKYNHLDDDQVYIIKELDNLGIQFIPNQQNEGDNDEEQALNISNVNNSDDHDGEF